MKNFFLMSVLLLLISFGGRAQSTAITPSVINSAGGTSPLGGGIEVDYSIGETVITTQTTVTNIITQGFLQPGRLGISVVAYPTGVSCADKTDGVIKLDVSVSGASSSSTSLVYNWTPSSVCPGNNCSTVTNLAAGSYSVTVYLFSGNVKKDSTTVNHIVIDDSNAPCQIVVYNGVTPNGDGANDFFYIENIEQFPGNKVYIYNRWGLKIDEISNYNNQDNHWKGTLKHDGAVVPSGTYFYVIDLNNGTKPIKGWLELTHR